MNRRLRRRIDAQSGPAGPRDGSFGGTVGVAPIARSSESSFGPGLVARWRIASCLLGDATHHTSCRLHLLGHERLDTGHIAALEGTPGDAQSLFDVDEPVVREQFTDDGYFIVPGTMQRLDVADVREAADVAGVHSYDISRTVGVFERDGVFAMAELEVGTRSNPFIAWLGVYQNQTELRPVGPNPPAVMVDRTLPYFSLAIADLRDGVGFVEVDWLR